MAIPISELDLFGYIYAVKLSTKKKNSKAVSKKIKRNIVFSLKADKMVYLLTSHQESDLHGRQSFLFHIKIPAQMRFVGTTSRPATLGSDLVRSHKPSKTGSGQRLDGRPPGETQVLEKVALLIH